MHRFRRSPRSVASCFGGFCSKRCFCFTLVRVFDVESCAKRSKRANATTHQQEESPHHDVEEEDRAKNVERIERCHASHRHAILEVTDVAAIFLIPHQLLCLRGREKSRLTRVTLSHYLRSLLAHPRSTHASAREQRERARERESLPNSTHAGH
jgi:hypothetical protein